METKRIASAAGSPVDIADIYDALGEDARTAALEEFGPDYMREQGMTDAPRPMEDLEDALYQWGRHVSRYFLFCYALDSYDYAGGAFDIYAPYFAGDNYALVSISHSSMARYCREYIDSECAFVEWCLETGRMDAEWLGKHVAA